MHAAGSPLRPALAVASAERRVHSRYERRLSDTAISNQQTVLHLRVRRFFCDDGGCEKKTFAEQVPGLTFRHDRCTVLLRKVREAIALALGGRAGARLAEVQAIGIGKDALLRLISGLARSGPGQCAGARRRRFH
ncbi:transposase family protein [Streptomyces sp. NBC_01092]|uniref:transposase family protein n=1 Tax=Streptomyces sp. NBC_01092 TaxID=2903748 RepID=UPI0038691692